MQHGNSECRSAKWELGTHCLGNTSAVRFMRVSLFLDGFNIPLNKGGKEGEAFRGLSWQVQETRQTTPRRFATTVASRRPLY